MKITKLKLYTVVPRWQFLKIETDEGYWGWGEPVVEGRAGVVRAAVKELERYLIGKDPMDIEDIWQVLYRGAFYRGGPEVMSAIAGIDQALWEEFGNTLDIGIDFHGRLHKSMAKVLAKELDQFHPMFLEEPVLTENLEALREIVRYTSAPIATGERDFSRWDFKRILEAGYVDIIQPDLSHAGGITECKKIASMAEAYDVAVAPHCPLGPVALSACVQLDMCTPNVFIQEQSLGIHYNDGADLLDYLKDPALFEYRDGYIQVPTKPGLSVEVDEIKLEEMDKIGHNWKNPVWRNFDGTVAEW